AGKQPGPRDDAGAAYRLCQGRQGGQDGAGQRTERHRNRGGSGIRDGGRDHGDDLGLTLSAVAPEFSAPHRRANACQVRLADTVTKLTVSVTTACTPWRNCASKLRQSPGPRSNSVPPQE